MAFAFSRSENKSSALSFRFVASWMAIAEDDIKAKMAITIDAETIIHLETDCIRKSIYRAHIPLVLDVYEETPENN